VAAKKKATTKKAPAKKPAGKVRSMTEAAKKRSAAAKKAAATRAANKEAEAKAKAAEAKPEPTPAAKRARRELPPVGTKLYARYKGKDYQAVIGQASDGKVVTLAGKSYPTLSAAGKAVTGKPTCNGWVFWSQHKGQPKPRGKK
jgi:hypothetical protein